MDVVIVTTAQTDDERKQRALLQKIATRLFIESLAFVVFVFAKWPIKANCLALKKPAGKEDIRDGYD